MEKWLIKQILKKPEYGTPEYWEKERKSKFKRDARQKEEQVLKSAEGIINLWSATVSVDIPLYKLLTKDI